LNGELGSVLLIIRRDDGIMLVFFRLKGLPPRFHFRRKETTGSYNKFLKRKRVQQKGKNNTNISAARNKSRD
jgi:hypothetical protein